MEKEACKLLGTILKPNGFKGKLLVKLAGEIPDRNIELGPVFLEINSGLVPFFLMPTDGLSFKSNSTANLHLEGFDSDQKAKVFIGKKVYLPSELFPQEEEGTYESLIGFTVKDSEKGVLGSVVDYMEISMNNVLVVEHKDTKNEILIPATPDIVTDIDFDNLMICTECPEGLIDLYLEV